MESAVAGYVATQGFAGLPGSLLKNPESFTDTRWRIIFSAALAVHSGGSDVNRFTINEEIRVRGLDGEIADLIPQGWEDWNAYTDSSYDCNPRAVSQCLRDIIKAAHDRVAYEAFSQAAEGTLDRHQVMERLESIRDQAGEGDFPQMVDANALCTKPPAKPPELIHGLLHRGAKMVLGGGSKSFKTWTLLQMAVGVAAGRDFLEFPCEQGRVLFVNLEIQDAFFAERLMAIQMARGILIEPGQMDVLNLRGFAADAAVLLPKITEQASKRDYSMIILDPLYKLLGGRDENASTDMAELLNEVERVAVNTGAAVVFGSHFAKGNASGKESMDRISGSGVFARDPDTIITMTRHEEDDAFTVDMTLRNHPPQEAFVVRRQHPLMVPDSRLDPSKLKQVAGRTAIHSADDVIGILKGRELTTSEWQRSCEKEGISESTFHRRRRELEKAGRIFRSKIDQKWSLK